MSSDGGRHIRSTALAGPLGLAIFICFVSFLTIAGAWGFEWAGYVPCELCLKERIPHYAGVPLAALVAVLAARGRSGLLNGGFLALALVYGAGTVMAGYHAGVEWHFWAGPASCTGSYAATATVTDFLHQLQTVNVVRCDAAAVRVLGLSLAAWDMLICFGLAVLALRGLMRVARPVDCAEGA